MMLPISVVIPTYNRAKFLPRAIASALAACAPGDEIVVVDDGSTDDTQAAIAPYRTRIRYLLLPHGGMAATRNAGMAAARHDLVAFLDSDDEFMPDKLTLQRAVLAQSPDVVMVLSDFAHRSASGGIRHRELANWTGDRRGWGEILGGGVPFTDYAALPAGRPACQVYIGDLYPLLVARSYAAPLVAVVRRDRVGPGPWFPEDLSFHCDWEALARFARCGPVAFLDCETAWNWGHDGPRMTDISQGAYWAEYLTMLQRLWGQDAAFLAAHGGSYRAALYQAHKRRARWLLKEGRVIDARGDLEAIGGGPLAYRLAAALPARAIPVELIHRARSLSRPTSDGHTVRHIPRDLLYAWISFNWLCKAVLPYISNL
ncbi:MAG TPA: glycosyltransferase family A protein [Thermomicrobiales bacterium]|jgi:glycosyltransferase involved in cell wall biosynthesis